MTAIMTRGLTKVYKRHLGKPAVASLDSLSLDVGKNEVFGFLGRNGAGKTTAIKLLCSLLHPTRGEAFILGKNTRTPEARRSVGYLPEDPYFYEYLTPRETLDFYGQLQGLDARARAAEWEKLSVLLDLAEFAGQRVREFSKGMRQRLGFAVALVGDPEILILDEPMSGLDPLGRRAIRELILKMRYEKKTLFFSSHVLGDVEQICDRVGILVKGRLTVQGRLDQLLANTIEQVEVIVSGLDPKTVAEIAAHAVSTRTSEAGYHFHIGDVNAANDVVRTIHARGGRLVEFTPIKESLEDYFMRKQEPRS
jgi:ABC-2 type transport system ATP-binding protein